MPGNHQNMLCNLLRALESRMSGIYKHKVEQHVYQQLLDKLLVGKFLVLLMWKTGFLLFYIAVSQVDFAHL
jgi:hypothetical protein